MARIWKPNEHHTEDDELVVTDHRDEAADVELPGAQHAEETTETDAGEVLEEFGEDVASSPAQRAQDVPTDTESAG